MLRLTLAVLLLSGTLASGQDPEDRSRQKAPKIAPEDFKEYMDLVRTRAQNLPESRDLEAATRNSFERIYLHQLRSNFQSKPSPRRVMEKIKGIFREFDAAQRTLRTLRGNVPAASSREMNKIMDRLDHSARTIQGDFEEYFTELNRGSLNIEIPQLGEDAQQWRFYLVRVDQCFSILNEQLQQYFFRPEPGRVAVQDYRNPGVATITKAIRQLTRIYRERLKVR
jgi:hypothetical protein